MLISRHFGGIETEKYIKFRNCCTNLCHKMSVDTVISACNALLGSGIWGSILKAIKCIKQCQQNIIFRIYTVLKMWHHKISTLKIRSLWFVTDSRGLCFHTEYNNKGSSKTTVLLYDASSFNKIKRYMQSQADFINAHDDNYFYVEQRWPGFYSRG